MHLRFVIPSAFAAKADGLCDRVSLWGRMLTKLFIVGEINPFTEMPVGEWSLPDGVSSIRFRADAMRTVWCPVLLIAAKHSKLPVLWPAGLGVDLRQRVRFLAQDSVDSVAGTHEDAALGGRGDTALCPTLVSEHITGILSVSPARRGRASQVDSGYACGSGSHVTPNSRRASTELTFNCPLLISTTPRPPFVYPGTLPGPNPSSVVHPASPPSSPPSKTAASSTTFASSSAVTSLETPCRIYVAERV
eukprot:2172150-Rhodomonas_salina.1